MGELFVTCVQGLEGFLLPFVIMLAPHLHAMSKIGETEIGELSLQSCIAWLSTSILVLFVELLLEFRHGGQPKDLSTKHAQTEELITYI